MPDFSQSEYHHRLERVRRAMTAAGIDALLLTTEPEIRYFSGFRTQFWQSPTRPWFLIVPRAGEPVAIIPEIGAELMASSGMVTVRSWLAPTPEDDGISLLQDALHPYPVVGLLKGHETHLRMPLADFERLQSPRIEWRDATPLIRQLRMVKSDAEIALIAQICTIASDVFAKLPDMASVGQPLEDVFRRFKISLLSAGADDVPYLVGGAGAPSYRDVISPPTASPLKPGDVLMLDTGATLSGYFCDFDRNVAIGSASDSLKRAYQTLWHATETALKTVRPGLRASDLYRTLAAELGTDSGIGRLGHGLGMQLTEWPSLASWDDTVLEENMVITLEPGIAVDGGGILVTEENLVVEADGCRLLSTRAPEEIPVIDP